KGGNEARGNACSSPTGDSPGVGRVAVHSRDNVGHCPRRSSQARGHSSLRRQLLAVGEGAERHGDDDESPGDRLSGSPCRAVDAETQNVPSRPTAGVLGSLSDSSVRRKDSYRTFSEKLGKVRTKNEEAVEPPEIRKVVCRRTFSGRAKSETRRAILDGCVLPLRRDRLAREILAEE